MFPGDQLNCTAVAQRCAGARLLFELDRVAQQGTFPQFGLSVALAQRRRALQSAPCRKKPLSSQGEGLR